MRAFRAIEGIAILFMLLSGVNFALHFLAVRSRRLGNYLEDAEFKTFILFLFALTVLVAGYLTFTGTSAWTDSIQDGLFHVVSIGTTTGFTTEEYSNWPVFLPILLLFASFVGGCAGSTGGGMKVIRVVLLFKQGYANGIRVRSGNSILCCGCLFE